MRRRVRQREALTLCGQGVAWVCTWVMFVKLRRAMMGGGSVSGSLHWQLYVVSLAQTIVWIGGWRDPAVHRQ